MGNNKLKSFRQFLTEEDGMGTVEVILIIVGTGRAGHYF